MEIFFGLLGIGVLVFLMFWGISLFAKSTGSERPSLTPQYRIPPNDNLWTYKKKTTTTTTTTPYNCCSCRVEEECDEDVEK